MHSSSQSYTGLYIKAVYKRQKRRERGVHDSTNTYKKCRILIHAHADTQTHVQIKVNKLKKKKRKKIATQPKIDEKQRQRF